MIDSDYNPIIGDLYTLAVVVRIHVGKKQCHEPPKLGMVTIPAGKMVMTGGGFMKLFYQHSLFPNDSH